MTDVTILYQGGSGGFFLYYYLLLSGHYQFDIPTVQKIIQEQFGKNLLHNPSDWKNKEHWPDNQQLKSQSGNKVFLICNPLFSPDMLDQNLAIAAGTYKILLYTDLKLQLRMAWEKQAYWFTSVSRNVFDAPRDDRSYIRKIIQSHGGQDSKIAQIQQVFRPDEMIRLETLVQGNSKLNIAPTQHQTDFLNQWYELQPPKSKKLLNRKII
jgi:hypothetical protein